VIGLNHLELSQYKKFDDGESFETQFVWVLYDAVVDLSHATILHPVQHAGPLKRASPPTITPLMIYLTSLQKLQ
jgi:hypothetical protein